MGIEIIGKLTQKNNGDFKLVDLADVDYDGTGKSAKQELENKIEEAKNSSTPYDDTEVKTDINNIKTDLGTEELTTTSKKLKGAINELGSQIKEKANKNDLEVERKRIDSLVSLPDGSTTGDAELIDARISADAIVYDSVGSAIREQYNKLNTTLDNQMYGCEMIINYSNLPILSNGYVKGSNGVSTGKIDLSSTSHEIVTIPIKHLKSIKLQRGSSEVSSGMVYGDIYDSENDTLYYSFNTTNADELVTIKDEWRDKSQLRLNWFNYKTSPYISSCHINFINVTDIVNSIVTPIVTPIVSEYEKIISEYEKKQCNIYDHCVNKPFTFENKSALFFGDSITKGYTNGSTITGNGFPKLLSDKLGMTYSNHGVGGSCLSYNYNNLGSILDKIKSVGSLTSDFLFVAGGVNDWQTATDLDTFKNGVVDICEYLSANYNGKVIFITPINHAGRTPISTPVADLQQYRNIITETVLKYSSFSVVQGNLIPMPNEKSSDEYKAAMFGDKLHPTELGYTVYARALVTILG